MFWTDEKESKNRSFSWRYDENKGNQKFQHKMPPSPTDEGSAENIITEQELVVETVGRDMRYLVL